MFLFARGQFAVAKCFLFSVNLILQFIQGFKERKLFWTEQEIYKSKQSFVLSLIYQEE